MRIKSTQRIGKEKFIQITGISPAWLYGSQDHVVAENEPV